MLQQSELDWLASQRPKPVDLDPTTTTRVRAELVSHAEGERSARSRLLARLPHPRPRLRHAAYAAAAAAAAFAALLATSLAGGQHHGNSLAGLGVQSASAASLVHLSEKLAEAPAPSGDATLVIRQQVNLAGTSSETELFTDAGSFYATSTLPELSAAVKAKETINEGSADGEARDIAAAKAALTGPIAAARHEMSIAALEPGVTPKSIEPPAAALAKARQANGARGYSPPSALESENSSIWLNSVDALVAGAGSPQVRAGVLDLLSTIPQITVNKGTSEGQATLVLDYASSVPASGYHERLMLNSDTGVPMELLGGPAGQAPSTTIHYKITRVTAASIEAGSHPGS